MGTSFAFGGAPLTGGGKESYTLVPRLVRLMDALVHIPIHN